MKKGLFVISLDFELLWGVFDKINPTEKRKYFLNTISVIPEILNLFKENAIHATWATVGMLFNENWEEWKKNMPDVLPEYTNKNLSAYNFGKQFCQENHSEDYCFSPSTMQNIAATPFQEVATHTYSHYYCLEEGQTYKSFEADLDKCVEMARKQGIILKSLVFPRNQFNSEYLKICKNLGIENVRSNPVAWYWKNPNSTDYMTKIGRTGDVYLPFGKKSYSIEEVSLSKEYPVEQKASRFFRPVESNDILRRLKIRRIMKEMSLAAKNNEIYHLWWHPHNFGENPKESLNDLRTILRHYKSLQKENNFQSVTMEELGSSIKNANVEE